MPGPNEFKIVITALNKTTAGIRAAKEDFRSMTQPIREVGVAVSALAEESGFATLAQKGIAAFKKIGGFGLRTIAGIGREILLLSGPLGALGAAAGGFGIFEIVKSTAEYVKQANLGAQKTGLLVGELEQLHFIGKVAGVEQEQLDKGLERLNVTLGKVATGKGKDAAAMFAHYGIKLRDVRTHHMRPTIDILADLSAVMQKHTGIVERTAIATTAFSVRSGTALIPFLLLGKQRTLELAAEFKRLHGVLDPLSAKIGLEATEAFEKLDLAASGLKNAIGLALAPALTDLITPLSEWIAANRHLISSRVGEWAKEIGTRIKEIDWKTVGTEAKHFGEDALTVLGAVARTIEYIQHLTNTGPKAAVNAAAAKKQHEQFVASEAVHWWQPGRALDELFHGKGSSTNADVNLGAGQAGFRTILKNFASLFGMEDTGPVAAPSPIASQPIFGARPVPFQSVPPTRPGEVNVKVDFNNLPPGATVKTDTRGPGVSLDTGIMFAPDWSAR